MTNFVITGTWDFADRCREPYLYLPLEIPEGVACLEVSYHSSLRSSRGAEHVDIGIFDERGHAHGSPGFRGWSGSARERFSISASHATPGYVPGAIRPGAWSVVLGTESREQADIDYEVHVALLDEVPHRDHVSTMPLFPERTLELQPRFFHGDLHCHTVDSDGSHVLPDVVHRAIDRGLDFLAITNHNVLVKEAPLEDGVLDHFLLLGGEEVTTYRGHMNVWGIHDWIDFRVHENAGMQRVVDRAIAQGGVTSINHPKTGGPEWEYDCLPGIYCMEVWGAPWVINNHESLALYDRFLAQGHRITAVGGSDIHVINTQETPHPYELGNPTTHVYAEELSEKAILAGLRSGRVSITADPTMRPVELAVECGEVRTGMGQAVAHVGGDCTLTIDAPGYAGTCIAVFVDGAHWTQVALESERQQIPCPTPRTYVRVEVLRESCDALEDRFALALTNPVYFDGREQ